MYLFFVPTVLKWNLSEKLTETTIIKIATITMTHTPNQQTEEAEQEEEER